MTDKKPTSPDYDLTVIKPDRSGKWVPLVFLAGLFLTVFISVEIAGYVVDDLETRVKRTVMEKVEGLLGQFRFSFKTSSGIFDKKSSQTPKPRKAVTSLKPFDFEGGALALGSRNRGGASGTLKEIRRGRNGMLALRLNPLTPSDRKKQYGLTGMLDLEAAFRTPKANGAYFSVRSDVFKKFDFSLWSFRNGAWAQHLARDIKVGRKWVKMKIPFHVFDTKPYNMQSGKYSGTVLKGKADYIYWVGWEINERTNRAGLSGELQIDNFGFY